MAKDSSATVRQQSPRVHLATRITELDESNKSSDTLDSSRTHVTNDHDSNRSRIEALAEIICAAGAESAAALLLLMRALETSDDPIALAHTVKHFAFTRCGELNVYEMVDAQTAAIESELLREIT